MLEIRTPELKKDFIALVLIFSVAAVLAAGYSSRVGLPMLNARMSLHDQIISGTAPSPYRYRVLTPYLAELLAEFNSLFLAPDKAFLLSYASIEFLAIFLILAILFYWLKNWFPRDKALIGALFLAGTMPIALRDHYFQPWSLTETVLFSAALFSIFKQRFWALILLLLFASLNRETALFIPLAFLLTSSNATELQTTRRRIALKPILLSGTLVLEWVIIYLSLRYYLGNTPHIHTIAEIASRNLAWNNLVRMALNSSLFLGGFWVLTALGYRYAPRFIKKLTWLMPIYLMIIAIWGVWHEARLLMPLYPVLIPLGMSFVCRPVQESQVG